MDMRSSKLTMMARIKYLENELADKPTKQERVFMQCLDMTLRNCDGWTIGKKKINDAEGYCKLAKIFADNAVRMF